MKIVIADCNHGFFTPEIEESNKFGIQLEICPDLSCLDSSVKDADIIIVQRFQVTSSFLDQLPKCKVIARYGVGLDNIDCGHAKKVGMSIVSFPGFCTEEVANHTLSSILFCQRSFDVLIENRNLLSGMWGNPEIISHVLASSDTKVGIVGIGRIGSAVCRRLHACGFEVIATDPYVPRETWDILGIRSVSLEALFESCNIVTLHTPLTNETRGMVSKYLLESMLPKSVLINTSRGEVVITSDLIEAARNNLRAAFLDVCDPEPPSEELLSVPNIYLSHHCAFYSQRSLDILKRGVIVDSVRAYREIINEE